MGKLQVIVGGQFGSEGKGALAAWLARREWRPIFAIRVAGPNAGHTAYDDEGRQFKLQQIPVAAVVKQHTPGQIALGIAAGSEIDLKTLYHEIVLLEETGHSTKGRLYIDSQATLIEEKHVAQERGTTNQIGEFHGFPIVEDKQHVLEHGEGGLTRRIGSTGKGVGAARAARIMREAKTYGSLGLNVAKMAGDSLFRGHTVQIEGTQGYGLGLHAGYYPYCTSSDCRAVDFLSMAGVSPWSPEVSGVDVWVALRSHPIRVAGDSGPLEGETTWEDVGQEPEYTTVTKKIRRIGKFNPWMAREAILANGGTMAKVALMFGDYLDPLIAEQTTLYRKNHPWLTKIENEINHRISVVGTGPQTIAEVLD